MLIVIRFLLREGHRLTLSIYSNRFNRELKQKPPKLPYFCVISLIMSLSQPVAPLNLAFDRDLFALRRCATAVKQPCLALIRCAADAGQTPAPRRSANYQPNLWGDDRIRSLTINSPVSGTLVFSFLNFHSKLNGKFYNYHLEAEQKEHTGRIKLLKEKVRKVIYDEKEVEEQLQLIDQLQQLGVAYRFKDDIKDSLSSLHASLEDIRLKFKDNLHASAVLFRLLRENGFSVSEGNRSIDAICSIYILTII